MEPQPPEVNVDAFLAARLEAVIPQGAMGMLRLMARLAAERGWGLYLVGGYVRDCLLKIPDYDIDVSVEGDAPELAGVVAAASGAQVEVHGTFGTAILTWETSAVEFDIDLVTARRETYERPGALPTVQSGTILDDLARRDFTVNAMAMRLDPVRTGPLLDPHRGMSDLQERKLRVLHDLSFMDDPTRIFRAVRLAIRLGFEVEQHTGMLMEQAIKAGALSTVSMERITHELRLIWQESLGEEMMLRLDEMGVLEKIHPDLQRAIRAPHVGSQQNANLGPEQRKSAYLASLGFRLAGDAGAALALARHLRLEAHESSTLRDGAALARLWPRLQDATLRPSQVRRMLSPLGPDVLMHLQHEEADSQAAIWLGEYLTKLRHLRPALTGEYLRALGIPPGPVYREALDALMDASVDGDLLTRNDEESFLQAWLQQRGLLSPH